MTIYSLGDKPVLLPKTMAYDIDEKKYYSLTYRPPIWAANKPYISGVDVVMPSIQNGFYYECISGGISNATEPVFGTIENQKTTDGTVEWLARAYSFLLNPGDTITSSVWTGTNGEAIDNASIVGGYQTKFRLIGVNVNATEATIVNHIVVTRQNGDVEEFERSIVIHVKIL